MLSESLFFIITRKLKNKAFTYKKSNFQNSTLFRVRGLFMIKVFPKVIVTRVEVTFFDFIAQNLDFDSASQVPPYDKKNFSQKLSYIDR